MPLSWWRQKPDVLMADTSPSTAALQRETHTIPIVFVRVSDPVGQGFVADMARPGGNITGFINYEPAMSGKWVDLLKEAVPNIKRVALIYNPQTAPYTHHPFCQFSRLRHAVMGSRCECSCS